MKTPKALAAAALLLLLSTIFATACGDFLGDGVVPGERRIDSGVHPDRTGLPDTGGGRPDTNTSGRDQGQGTVDRSQPLEMGLEPAVNENGRVEQPQVDAGQPDQGTGTPDRSQSPKVCGQTTFRYDSGGAAVKEVLVAGEFNSWADSVAKGALAMKNTGGSLWEATTTLKEGTWEYKLIVDGNWMLDPKNPNKVSDGKGNENSAITIKCGTAGLELISHKTSGSRFDASFRVGGAAFTISATVDHSPVPNSSTTKTGDGFDLALTGLARGIHDVRVSVADGKGNTSPVMLLKVYVGTSSDWRDVTLYFAMTDRFHNGDTNNDNAFKNTPKLLNYMGGDFKGISKKLDAGYFDKLGVNAIWISWPVDNPDHVEPGGRADSHWCGMNPKDKSIKYVGTNYTGYHGYWPVKLDKVEERFGTRKELQEMVTKAHARGIRILLDFTANHVHQDSDFYKNGIGRGFFHLPKEICQDVGWDVKPVECWFVSYLPDLNYSKAEVVKAVLDHAVHWVKLTGADGFRVDALKHVELSFIRALRSRMTQEFEKTGVPFYMVGETFTGSTGIIKKFIGKDLVHGQFDFPLNIQLLKGFAKEEIGLSNMHSAAQGIFGAYGSGALMSTFIGNHDIARFISLASGSIRCGAWDVVSNQAQAWKNPPQPPSDPNAYKKLQLAFAYIFSLPGIPLIYYGDEVGLPGAGDPDNRRMMRFDGQLSANEKSTLAFMQKLGKARQQHEVLRRGLLGPTLKAESSLLAFSRTGTGGPAVIVLNRGAKRTVSLSVSSLGVGDGTAFVDALSGGAVTVSGGILQVSVEGRGAAILVKK